MSNCRLFIDKYSLNSFNDIQFNQNVAQKLIACSKVNDIPHLIIKGFEGCGRKTFANLYIKSKYNITNFHTKYQTISIKYASKIIKLQMLYSDFHYQIDPSIHGVYDRTIVQSFIKDILQTKPISKIPYHIIIITNADHLTIEAQQSLRRTLEKNINNSRFIFIVDQESTLIESLVSRCIQIRLSSPNNNQICTILESICQNEKIPFQKKQLEQIVHYSRRNLTKAMNMLQYISLIHPKKLSLDVVINFNEINVNEKHLLDLGNHLIIAKTPQDILQLRSLIHDLLVQCIKPVVILKYLFEIVLEHLEKNHVTEEKKYQLVQILSKYESTLKQGNKPIYHLEAASISIIIMLNH